MSVFIAREQRRSLGPLADELAVSVITIGELEPGDPERPARRADTVRATRRVTPLQTDTLPR